MEDTATGLTGFTKWAQSSSGHGGFFSFGTTLCLFKCVGKQEQTRKTPEYFLEAHFGMCGGKTKQNLKSVGLQAGSCEEPEVTLALGTGHVFWPL